MKESFTAVRTFRVELICDCGSKMEMMPTVYMTSPPLYEYMCQKCGIKETSRDCYPKIVYEKEDAK